MISWLQGQIIKKWHLSSKKGVVLNVGGVGYEVQLLSKQISNIDNRKVKEFWIHQINREDCTNLYGFNEIDQRDLFRKIIGVNGIGPQIAMALLEDFEVNQLVETIEENDSDLLMKSQGIGKRIAERLVVELKSKLKEFKDKGEKTIHNKKTIKSNKFINYIDEIKSILNSLGYMDNEIKDGIKLITTNEKENTLLLNSLSKEEKSELMDNHLKKILIILSQKST
tara:strand:+ start:654 stop:1328 length:675 start_codon:yes stop_codon:yes gene_type:complete